MDPRTDPWLAAHPEALRDALAGLQSDPHGAMYGGAPPPTPAPIQLGPMTTDAWSQTGASPEAIRQAYEAQRGAPPPRPEDRPTALGEWNRNRGRGTAKMPSAFGAGATRGLAPARTMAQPHGRAVGLTGGGTSAYGHTPPTPIQLQEDRMQAEQDPLLPGPGAVGRSPY
jgi:hypothetical protein